MILDASVYLIRIDSVNVVQTVYDSICLTLLREWVDSASFIGDL